MTTGASQFFTVAFSCVIFCYVNSQNAPVFSKPYYNVSIPENTRIGVSPVTVTATDPDTSDGSGIRYSLNDTSNFIISRRGGVITYDGGLDYEKPELRDITLSVTATDAGTPQMSTSVLVYVHVTDVNDVPPKFRKEFYNVQIVNGEKLGTFVTQVQADDKDLNSTLTYSLVVDTQYFQIDNVTGVITTSQVVNKTAILDDLGTNLPTRVSDGLRSDIANVRLTIVDPNNYTPEFDRLVYEGSVDETSVAGRIAVLKVNASDGDTGPQATLSYSLASTDYSDNFEIDSTGAIWFVGTMDRESLPSPGVVTLVVLVSDSGLPPATTNTTVTVVINDVDDNGPKFIEQFFSLEMVENFPKDFKITSLPKAVDADVGENAVVRYNLSAEGLDLFNIDPLTGDLLTKFSCRQTCPLTNVSTLEFKLFAYNAADQAIEGDFIWIRINMIEPPPTTTPTETSVLPVQGGTEAPALSVTEIVVIVVVSCVILLIIIVIILVLLVRRSKVERRKDKIEFNPSSHPPEKVENEIPGE